jgi:hypothetical protein
MIEQFQTGWNAYKDLQDVGIVNSFENKEGKFVMKIETTPQTM